jgi:hypothetical protein
MSSCGPIFMGGNCNGTVKKCKVKEQSIYRPQYVLCDTPFVPDIVLHVSTQRRHPQALIIAKLYNQHNNVLFLLFQFMHTFLHFKNTNSHQYLKHLKTL